MNPRRGLLHYGAEFLLFLILAAVLVFAIQLIPKGNLTESDNSAPLAAYPPPATNTPGPTVTSPPYPLLGERPFYLQLQKLTSSRRCVSLAAAPRPKLPGQRWTIMYFPKRSLINLG
jgi:hypothetical protein